MAFLRTQKTDDNNKAPEELLAYIATFIGFPHSGFLLEKLREEKDDERRVICLSKYAQAAGLDANKVVPYIMSLIYFKPLDISASLKLPELIYRITGISEKWFDKFTDSQKKLLILNKCAELNLDSNKVINYIWSLKRVTYWINTLTGLSVEEYNQKGNWQEIYSLCKAAKIEEKKALSIAQSMIEAEINLAPPCWKHYQQAPVESVAGDLAGLTEEKPAPLLTPPTAAQNLKTLFDCFVAYLQLCAQHNPANLSLYIDAYRKQSPGSMEWTAISSAFKSFLPIKTIPYDTFTKLKKVTLSTAAGNAIMLLAEDRFNPESYSILMKPIEMRLAEDLPKSWHKSFSMFNGNKKYIRKHPNYPLIQKEYRFLEAALTCIRSRIPVFEPPMPDTKFRP